MERLISTVNERFLGIVTPLFLILGGILLAIRLRLFPIFRLGTVLRTLVRGSGNQKTDGIPPIRALLLALAGTLGVGNIVGVAGAIFYGGVGSVFWMWISALAAMILKYSEIVLSHKYRTYGADGKPHGSAMGYIRAFFESLSLPRLGRAVAAVFAVMCAVNAVSMGCIVQINAVAHAMGGVFSVPPLVTGVLIALSLLLILIIGRGFISRVTEALVPLASILYLALAATVIALRSRESLDALADIVKDALNARSAVGGIMGFITSRSLRFGTMRGLLSNEGGCGTAPIAHSESSETSGAAQGFLGIAEVFIDTVLLCTVTAIVMTVGGGGVTAEGFDPVMCVISSFSSVLGRWSEWVLGVCVLLFGYATVVCWAFYGAECARYLSRSCRDVVTFEVIYLTGTVVGALIAPSVVLELADAALGIMTVINVPILCLMSGTVKQETDSFFNSIRRRKTN